MKTSSVKPEMHNVSQLQSEENQATATGDTHKFGEVQLHGFRVMRADKQTDRQTLQYPVLCNPIKAK